MELFILMLFALGSMGFLAIFSIEPVRRSFFEGMAITLVFAVSFILAVVIYLGIQSI